MSQRYEGAILSTVGPTAAASGAWTSRQQMQLQGTGTWPMPPGAPTIGTATAGDTTVSVAFTAPSYTGYPAGVTGYTATSSPGGFTGTGASSPITVSGLTNGTAYTFTVTATNATGTGPASAASNSVTPTIYIEDVFSTYLYTGDGTLSRAITNNIDLSTKGGLVWSKDRVAANSHFLCDTARGVLKSLKANSTDGEFSTFGLSAVSTTGYVTNATSADYFGQNTTGTNLVSWTFRKQPKFFDVVTYSGTGSPTTIAHNLGSAPGCIIVKRTNRDGDNWKIYHRSTTATQFFNFTTAAAATDSTYWNDTEPTSTVFTVGTDASVNGSGGSFVAYLFAHDAGGFGLTGTDNVISCASYTGNGSATGPVVTLGYEPQWLMIKNSSGVGNWKIIDNMRGMPVGSADATLQPNLSNAESNVEYFSPTATGFQITSTSSEVNTNGSRYVYVAIRRGPMKVPTDSTTVFTPVAYTGTDVDNRLVNTGIVTDMAMARIRSVSSTGGIYSASRLRGNASLATALPDAQNSDSDSFMTPTSGVGNSFSAMNGFGVGNDATRQLNQAGTAQFAHGFKRAPSFFDVVTYTGTGSIRTIEHNLTVAPQLMIVKQVDGSNDWVVYAEPLGATKLLTFNADYVAATSSLYWNNTAPTASVFTVGTNGGVNLNTFGFVAYLFATCAGVSKVGGYTGTGTLTTIDCGFTGGARYVLIKRTNSAANWFIWDTARGMVAGTDPSITTNLVNGQSNANSVYTITTGFQLLASPAVDVNTNGGSYIYLAIA